MTRRGPSAAELLLGVLLAVSGVTAMAALVVAVERVPPARPTGAAASEVAIVKPAAVPIEAEAGVFRTHPGMLAIGDPSVPRRHANPRTLQTFRARRAFPGAPPRIPHGLTSVEFQTSACNTCHERGGYSPRFGAYVPVTPHPEWGACLQCHVGDDATTGVVLPSSDPNTICRQCHDPSAVRLAVPSLQWRMAVWPQLTRRAPGGPPPPIPHDLQLRGNCVTCHAGPGAVAEIRTAHPERANCRQCHVTIEGEVGTYTRVVAPASSDTSGGTR